LCPALYKLGSYLLVKVMRVIDPDQGGEVDFQELKDIIENGPAAGSVARMALLDLAKASTPLPSATPGAGSLL
jgi:hypothetical protein